MVPGGRGVLRKRGAGGLTDDIMLFFFFLFNHKTVLNVSKAFVGVPVVAQWR